MKKTLCLILSIFFLTLMLASCGGSGNASDVGSAFPNGMFEKEVNSLLGTYKMKSQNSIIKLYLTFTEDGELKITEAGSYSSHWKTCDYRIEDGKLIVSGLGYFVGCPIYQDGEYTFSKNGDTLTIANSEWTLSKDKLPK